MPGNEAAPRERSRQPPPPVCLEEFAVDPQLGNFAEASPAQRATMRLLDGLPPADAEQREVAEELLGRTWHRDLAERKRVALLLMGADSGKSVMAALLLLHRALFASLQGLRPGQPGVALLVGPDRRLAAIPLSYARGVCETSRLIREEVDGPATTDMIRFRRGTELLTLPATWGGRAVRGRRFVAAVLEECCFFRDSDYRINDMEIVRAVRPRLLPGGQLLGISTPYRKLGWAYQTHREEFGHSLRSLVLHAPTALMRPDKAATDLAEERAADPVGAAAELDAQFLDNVSGLFDDVELLDVIDQGVRRREPEEGWLYTAAMDPSGLRNDPWAFTIVGEREDHFAQFVSHAWPPGSSVERIVDEIVAEMKEFGLHRLFADQYGSEVTKAVFARAGLDLEERPFTAGSSSPKTRGFLAAKDLVMARRIHLLDDPILLRELRLLEVTKLAGGGERIAAPGRLHDDRACALALAIGEATQGPPNSGLMEYMRQAAAKLRGGAPEPKEVQT